jgi:flagellar hook-associated protein 3 FlgL
MFQTSLLRNIQNAETKQQALFNQIASGKKINKPSDDPMGVKKIVSIKDELSQVGRFQQNNAEALEFINFGERSLSSVLSKLEISMATAQQARNATVDAETREMLASQIKEIIESMVSDANTKHGDKYLFGGTITKNPPFILKNDVTESLTLSGVDVPILLEHVQLSDTTVTVEANGKSYADTNFTIDKKNGSITIHAGSEMETDGVTDFTISYETQDSIVVYPKTGDTKGANNREIMKGDVLQVNLSGEQIFI